MTHTEAGTPQQGLLDGIRVLCLAEQFPGPYATLILADHGADVILVERPKGGDPARAFPAFHQALGRNKRSIVLDLKSDSGREQLLRLAGSADVVLEGYTPGTADRLGIGYAAVSSANPAIVYVSISGFGQSGPYRDRPGHDLSFQAMAGLLAEVPAGLASADPPQTCFADLSSGLYGAMAVLMGLYHRQRSGQGLYVDVAMLDSTLSLMMPMLVPALNGADALDFLQEPAYRLFRTRDGRTLSLSIAHEDHFWRVLCRVTGLEDLAQLGARERIDRRDAIIARLEAAMAMKTGAEWEAILNQSRIPFGPVNSPAAIAADPQVCARGMFVRLADSPGGPDHWHMRQPMVPLGFAHGPRLQAPRLGEHTEQVLRT